MRKTIIIATGILVFILLILIIISNASKSKQQVEKKNLLTPTTVSTENANNPLRTNSELFEDAKKLTPFETSSFRYYFDQSLNKVVVVYKSPQGKTDFENWLNQNNLANLADNKNIFLNSSNNIATSSTSLTPTINPLNDLFRSLLGQGLISIRTNNASEEPALKPSIIIDDTSPNIFPSNNNSGNFTYYGQCEQFSEVALPDGCNLCQAGCGPTTAAMILSSYLNTQYNPKTLVEIYSKNGYYLGCGGSSYYDAKSLFEDLGLKTTDYLSFNDSTADGVAGDLKKYIDSGWTFFTLADFKDGDGGGHYFWITDIDSKGNILAYDPYYGQGQDPPINENSRYPFPRYMVAFGVKRN